ncbi:MAG TPA: PDZ domain-containing protein, partial [Firmicutes bacterium]|nr:PDZ domain-containing protein [Bacillota bacterium]
MNNLWELIKFVLLTFTQMVTDLRYVLIIAVVFLLVYRQYAKIRDYERRAFNLDRLNPFLETVTALVYGIGGGLVATAFFVTLGISISDAGIAYLWLVALGLMLINPRFLCFAYAGGLVSLFSLLTGYPQLNIATLMALVAILHLVEALLIFVSGHQHASPMYFKHSSGRIVGGFSLQKFWPMPTIALIGAAVLGTGMEWETIAMPDWWPIFQSGVAVPPGHVLVHLLLPLVVALGYSDFVQTELPKTKARRSAGVLFLYSIILLGLALLANALPALTILPIIFSPLGHELVIYWGRRREKRNEPVFHGEDGVMVLDVYPDSPAAKMGLGAGDVIKSINGVAVSDLSALVSQVSPWVIDPVVVVENQFRRPQRREIEYKGKIPPIGIIPTPHAQQGFYVRIKEGPIRNWLRQWRAHGCLLP